MKQDEGRMKAVHRALRQRVEGALHRNGQVTLHWVGDSEQAQAWHQVCFLYYQIFCLPNQLGHFQSLHTFPNNWYAPHLHSRRFANEWCFHASIPWFLDDG